MKEMDLELLKLAEDDLQSLIEGRTEHEMNSEEFKSLSDAIDKSEDKINKAYKVIYDHQEALRDQDIQETLKKLEIDLQKEKYMAELEQKDRQFKDEMEFRKTELEYKNKQFMAELEQKTEQSNKELKQRLIGEAIKGGFVFAGVIVTSVGAFILQTHLKDMDFDNQKFWIPEIFNFEKTDRFSYPFGQALEKQICKL